MLPDQPWLRILPETRELFWTDECELVSHEYSWKDVGEVPDAPYAEAPAIDDFIRALVEEVASSPEKELYVRIQLWWASNDPVRHGQVTAPTWTGHNDNLTKLRLLLDESDPYQRLMAAEASRELCHFAQAAKLLVFDFPGNYQVAAGQIKSLNERKDQSVMPVRYFPSAT